MTKSLQKKMKLILALSCLTLTTVAADKTAITANATNRFTITGMHCDGCAGGLTAELKATPGVAFAQVTFSNKLAVVAVDTNKITTAKLTEVIKAAGFTAQPVKP